MDHCLTVVAQSYHNPNYLAWWMDLPSFDPNILERCSFSKQSGTYPKRLTTWCNSGSCCFIWFTTAKSAALNSLSLDFFPTLLAPCPLTMLTTSAPGLSSLSLVSFFFAALFLVATGGCWLAIDPKLGAAKTVGPAGSSSEETFAASAFSAALASRLEMILEALFFNESRVWRLAIPPDFSAPGLLFKAASRMYSKTLLPWSWHSWSSGVRLCSEWTKFVFRGNVSGLNGIQSNGMYAVQ